MELLPDLSRDPDTGSGQKNKQACTCSPARNAFSIADAGGQKLIQLSKKIKIKRHSHSRKDVEKVYTKRETLSTRESAQKTPFDKGVFCAKMKLWQIK